MQYRDNTPSANLKFSNIENRLNKTAKGFTKHYERWAQQGRQRIGNYKHPQYNNRGNAKEVLSLIVNGTTDELKGLGWIYKKLVEKEHPTDKGYFKKVYILTDAGRLRLKSARKRK